MFNVRAASELTFGSLASITKKVSDFEFSTSGWIAGVGGLSVSRTLDRGKLKKSKLIKFVGMVKGIIVGIETIVRFLKGLVAYKLSKDLSSIDAGIRNMADKKIIECKERLVELGHFENIPATRVNIRNERLKTIPSVSRNNGQVLCLR